jgi:hypothetical protein
MCGCSNGSGAAWSLIWRSQLLMQPARCIFGEELVGTGPYQRALVGVSTSKLYQGE